MVTDKLYKCREWKKNVVMYGAKPNITIVKTSLIGSMLSNLLLVLGMCFFFGGINRMEQHFNVTVADTAASLLALCVGSLIIPTAFHSMLSSKFNDGFRPKRESSQVKQGMSFRGIAQIGARAAAPSRGGVNQEQLVQDLNAEKEDNEIKEPQLTIWGAIITLRFSTALVAFCSEFMVDSISNLCPGALPL